VKEGFRLPDGAARPQAFDDPYVRPTRNLPGTSDEGGPTSYYYRLVVTGKRKKSNGFRASLIEYYRATNY
jgi:hypothetical protein